MATDLNRRSAALYAAAMASRLGAAATLSSGQPADAPSSTLATKFPDRARASNGRIITTREERKKIAALAHKTGIKLTATGRQRRQAKPTIHACIDENHIEAAKREQRRREDLERLEREKAKQVTTTTDPVPGRS